MVLRTDGGRRTADGGFVGRSSRRDGRCPARDRIYGAERIHQSQFASGREQAYSTSRNSQFAIRAPNATSRAAHQYAELIPHLREDAARNYRQISEAAAQGEDVTETVLSGLLPHAGSEKNRALGAWIYLTPAIHGEVTQWRQRPGWAQPEDWPQKAAAILDFVRAAVEEPDRLAEVCAAFSTHGSETCACIRSRLS